MIPEIVYPAFNNTDLNWGITVTTAGFQSIKPYSPYPTANHPQHYFFNTEQGRILDEYQLVFITKGSGNFISENSDIVHLNEGILFMLFPGEWHTYYPIQEAGWNTYWVGFKGKNVDSLVENDFLSKLSPLFRVGYNEEIVGLFRDIIQYAKNEKPGFQPLLGGLVMHILGRIYHLKRDENFSDKAIVAKINKARLIMREQVTKTIIPETIASELNISYSWFRRMFKQYTNVSPGQYINQLKTQKAKELLGQTTESIKQIAESLSFESAYYFSVFFKRQTGMTPGSYRKMSQGKQK